jgi:S1-C subfamily serine protease
VSEEVDWEIAAELQPNQRDCAFDLERMLLSVVRVRASVPDDAFTASILGTERAGSGVVIREDGLILTVGYLVTEAETLWLSSGDGRATQGHVLAFDQETGLGLVQALGRLDLPAVELGDASSLRIEDPVIVAAGGGRRHAIKALVVARQEFAGYWEYLLESAIFTAPAHPFWGGSALIGRDGTLLGIASLHVQQATGPEAAAQRAARDVNMVVPIDLLPPILDDLMTYGQINKPARPWLGVFSAENGGKVVVANVAEQGPAAAAGIRQGDVISAVRDTSVASLGEFYRKVWSCGSAGAEIPIEVERDSRRHWVRVKSADRNSYLKKPRLH